MLYQPHPSYTFQLVSVEPLTDFESGAPKTTKDGKPLAAYTLVAISPEERKPELVTCKAPMAQVAPGLVQLVKPACREWEMNGKRGVSFAAESVQAVKATA